MNWLYSSTIFNDRLDFIIIKKVVIILISIVSKRLKI